MSEELLPYYVKGLVKKKKMEIREPNVFPVDIVAKDF